ncbi:peptidoglycan DD-metalloendopeptidase family protein [Amycolatopsis sp. NPDC102389]|uniref:peptidoglycan DD-metalloendopeptidase family protein n=1 Tax=Amycolatopsis sp. NPDC102389 TaxID=3363941 RepID=UPI003809F8B8
MVALFGVALTLSSTLFLAPAAQAATARNGVCEDGEFCLYYNSDQQGSVSDFDASVGNYGTGADCYHFLGAGAGKGLCVKGNAASVWNRRDAVVTVFFKNGWTGPIDSFAHGVKGNLSSTYNENAGHLLGLVENEWLETGLYHSDSGHISSYFDGYVSTSGRHEGIDFARGFGVSVYSMTQGSVIRKTEGGNGSGGLSTLAIYNRDQDFTVIYLHLNPSNGLAVGEFVSRGRQIGTEEYRGASSAHTHVEYRPGRHESASDSTGDPVLDNPSPSLFWRNHGYNICCG